MAASTVSTLISRSRRFLRDWPDEDVLTASVSSSATSITVADATAFKDNWAIEIDTEVLVVTSTASSGTTVSVRRAARGSTAASHASGAVILKKPAFFNIEILDALNAGLEAMYPLVYKEVVDESLTTTVNTYEYTIPDMPSDTDIKIYHLSEVSLQENSDEAFYPRRDWTVKRGATPKLQFRRASANTGDTLRLHGYGPFPRLTLSGSLDSQFPRQAEEALVLYAASYLLGSGEAGRVRMDTGAVDNREQANAVGSSMRAARDLQQRFYARLEQAAMPPLPRHIKSVV